MSKRFSASVAARLMTCPASGNLELAIPNWVEPVEDRNAANAANDGTKRHLDFAEIMKYTSGDLRKMASAIQYVADLRATRRFKVLVEEKITATWLVSKPDTTADLVLYTQDEIHVIDLKSGKIPVEVVDNAQLLFGAVCYAPLAPKAKGVNLHILQPWADGNQHWFADTNVIKQFMTEALAAEAKMLAGDTTFNPSDHCTFCPANPHSRGRKGKPFCPAMMKIHYPPIIHEDEILAL